MWSVSYTYTGYSAECDECFDTEAEAMKFCYELDAFDIEGTTVLVVGPNGEGIEVEL